MTLPHALAAVCDRPDALPAADRYADARLWLTVVAARQEPHEGLRPWTRRMARRWRCSVRAAAPVCARAWDDHAAAALRGALRHDGDLSVLCAIADGLAAAVVSGCAAGRGRQLDLLAGEAA